MIAKNVPKDSAALRPGWRMQEHFGAQPTWPPEDWVHNLWAACDTYNAAAETKLIQIQLSVHGTVDTDVHVVQVQRYTAAVAVCDKLKGTLWQHRLPMQQIPRRDIPTAPSRRLSNLTLSKHIYLSSCARHQPHISVRPEK